MKQDKLCSNRHCIKFIKFGDRELGTLIKNFSKILNFKKICLRFEELQKKCNEALVPVPVLRTVDSPLKYQCSIPLIQQEKYFLLVIWCQRYYQMIQRVKYVIAVLLLKWYHWYNFRKIGVYSFLSPRYGNYLEQMIVLMFTSFKKLLTWWLTIQGVAVEKQLGFRRFGPHPRQKGRTLYIDWCFSAYVGFGSTN